jgi:hypothetical protein
MRQALAETNPAQVLIPSTQVKELAAKNTFSMGMQAQGASLHMGVACALDVSRYVTETDLISDRG